MSQPQKRGYEFGARKPECGEDRILINVEHAVLTEGKHWDDVPR